VVNNDDDPAFLRAITTPKRGIGHQTLGALGEFAGQYKPEPVRGAVSHSAAAALPAKRRRQPARVRPRVNDLEHRARHTMGRRSRARLSADWLKDIGYEQHLYDGEDSEKLAAARWTNVLEFCDWMASAAAARSTTRPAQRDRQRGKSLLEVAQTISLIVQPERARAGAGRGHAVHAACRQGAGMAARGAGRRERGPAAVSAMTRQRGQAGGR
jgi:ATP-dependent DNA helicase Rep